MTRAPKLPGYCLLFVLAASVGCGGGPATPPLVEVSGTVNFDGMPLIEGTITFKTVQTGAHDVIPIKDGKYQGKVAEGERRVEIDRFRKKVVGTGAMVGEVQENLVADEYNINSELTANVSRDGKNVFDFEVKSK